MSDYDVIIIGSGLGGLTAGLFAARHGFSVLVVEANIPGGHLVSIERIEDFPGFPDGVAGYDLCPTVQRQAGEQGAEFERAEVLSVAAEDPLWSVVTTNSRHRAKALIVASGSSLKDLAVPGAAKFAGRGVSHCASCDGPLYNGQIVGVAGGGDSALQEALTLANYAERVWVFHEESEFSAQRAYQQRALNAAKITARFRTVVEEVSGDDGVTGVRVRDLETAKVGTVELAALFVYIGMKPNTDFLREIVRLSDSGHVPTDIWMKTERDGLYAIGDIRQDSARQAIAAAGDGATAAIAAYRYINSKFYRS
jgi:thioredoxin reductase (NADPH)